MKRLFNASSPLGIALTVAGVVLALSPEARKSVRQLLVKGTAAILGMADQVKNVTTGAATKATESASSMMENQNLGSENNE
ncbi:MAG: putative secreted protein [Bacilli bacterium]|nr:putative secreted protein [Bacilli bacterium]